MCNADVRLTTVNVDGNGLHTQGHETFVSVQFDISLMSSKPSIQNTESTPSKHHHEIKGSLLPILRDTNFKNVSLRYVAFSADADGTSANFNSDLLKIVSRLDLGLDTHIDLALSAQLNAVAYMERFPNCLKMGCTDHTATDDPRNVNVENKLKFLYLSSEYLEPTFVATALIDSFCDVKAYHEDFQEILKQVAKLRHYWITTHDTAFAEGQIRGKIMYLLNALPEHFLHTREETAAWKEEHLSELFVQHPYQPPLICDGNTVMEEWKHFKPSGNSILLGGDDILAALNVDPTATDGLTKSGNSKKRKKAKAKKASLNLDSIITLEELEDFVEEILPFVDKKTPINRSQSKKKLKQIIRKEFEQYLDYPFDDIDDTMRVISMTESTIYLACSSVEPKEHEPSSILADRILLRVRRSLGCVLLKTIEAMSPMFFIATNDFCSCTIQQELLRNFHQEKANQVSVPWGTITAKGSGSLKIIDDKGYTFETKSLYVPESVDKLYVIKSTRPFEYRVKMLQKVPGIISYKQFNEEGYKRSKVQCRYDVYTNPQKGSIYVIFHSKQSYIPLHHLLELIAKIQVWSVIEYNISQLQKTLQREKLAQR